MYQPIMALDTVKPSGSSAVGFEALIRWNHPARDMVSPAEFIDVAEESGLIVPIGSWVLENAIATAAEWYRQAEIDVVKIDKSFVDTVSTAPQQRALVEGIVQLAQTLGLQVVAEGIEREVDRETPMNFGCPLGQGYLFARPLSHAAALDWLLAEHIAA
jgi:EAL domain-containing protein (putative c-di-GMP-specific phosphodiesterase class I)